MRKRYMHSVECLALKIHLHYCASVHCIVIYILKLLENMKIYEKKQLL